MPKKHQLKFDKLKFNNEELTFTTNTTRLFTCKNLNECDIDVISKKINNLNKKLSKNQVFNQMKRKILI